MAISLCTARARREGRASATAGTSATAGARATATAGARARTAPSTGAPRELGALNGPRVGRRLREEGRPGPNERDRVAVMESWRYAVRGMKN